MTALPLWLRTITLASLSVLVLGLAPADAHPRWRQNNPPGPVGGPGTNWQNPPGPRGGPGASRLRPRVYRPAVRIAVRPCDHRRRR